PVHTGSTIYFVVWRGSNVPASESLVDGGENFIFNPAIFHSTTTNGPNMLSLGVFLPYPPATGSNCLEIVVWSCPSTSTDPVTYATENHYYYQTIAGGYPTVDGDGLLHPRIELALE